MNCERRTLDLLNLLGDDIAEAVLDHLSPDQARRLRTARSDNDETAPSTRSQRHLLNDFEQFFRYAMARRPHALGIYSEDDEDEAADQARKAKTTNAKLTGDPLEDLQLLSIYQVAQAVESEQPRTSAILLSHLGPRLAAETLSLLTNEYQQLVVKELSREQHAPPILVDRIARVTFNRAATLSSEPPDRRDHSDRLAEVLRAVPKKYRASMLTAIEEEDADLSKTLLKKMYRFEDIADLDQRQVQRVLGEIDGGTLTTALCGASPEIVEAILGNLSRRARQSIEEELEFQKSVPEAVLKQARDSVAEAIAKVEQESD
jgi:flagellar motor switch protein FliG